jgi:glyoxylase-like metal-dependent hydrolase (beta-lactamase superfamily II)
VTEGDGELAGWVCWQPRPFPDANLLLLFGRWPALLDTGFVGHAEQTREWAEARAGGRVEMVVNTHWHADHVGGNAALQAAGAEIAASAPDAEALARRDPGCCLAEYLDQPVAPYSVDRSLQDGQVLRLGEADWQVVRTPGHTPGHLSLWAPEEGLLAVGDALSDYDVGWVATALDGPEAAATAVASWNVSTPCPRGCCCPRTGPYRPTPPLPWARRANGRSDSSMTPRPRSGTARAACSATR